MTVQDLIYELQQMNPNAQVRFASQPQWPFEYTISSAIQVDFDDETEVVYLEEGTQIGYLPAKVREELNW